MERKRRLLPGFISPELCQELVFIHKSCGVVGYRPRVFSTTLSHLVATNSAALIMPFIALRERVKEAMEEFFGCEFELFVEFTGLISWRKGANIGWHSDDNRDYLRQRHFSAVCYLNTYEEDFHGGLFHFQDGEPATVIPTLGTVLIYSANEDNIHCVDEVVDGERITMALWFTRDSTHDEDKKLIDQLFNAMSLVPEERDKPGVSQAEELGEENTGIASQLSQVEGENHSSGGYHDGDSGITKILPQTPSNAVLRERFVPLPASTNMYWVSESKESKPGHSTGCEAVGENISLEDDQGYDVRVKRLSYLGFQCVEQLDDPESIFERPVRLKYHHQDIAYEFANILLALQVVHFHDWRSCCMTWPCKSSSCYTDQRILREPKSDESNKLKRQRTSSKTSIIWALHHEQPQRLVLHKDIEETMIKPWENYVSSLWTDLSQMLPVWQTTGSLFVG